MKECYIKLFLFLDLRHMEIFAKHFLCKINFHVLVIDLVKFQLHLKIIFKKINTKINILSCSSYSKQKKKYMCL